MPGPGEQPPPPPPPPPPVSHARATTPPPSTKSSIEELIDDELRLVSCMWLKNSHVCGSGATALASALRFIAASPNVPVAKLPPSVSAESEFAIAPVLTASSPAPTGSITGVEKLPVAPAVHGVDPVPQV